MLKEKIIKRESGILTYGITPPRQEHDEAKKKEIAQRQIERVRELPIHGLVIYDLQDESARTDLERPFPFLPTIDSGEYANDYLGELKVAKIIYRCVGKYDRGELNAGLRGLDADSCVVFVGPASREQKTRLSLAEAYELRKEIDPSIVLGAVTIPERHIVSGKEHLNVVRKTTSGVQFFISQAVYNSQAAKNFLSDYHYHCRSLNSAPAPIILTLTPCGSPRTLEFMKWLGISFPVWLENDLKHASDILGDSVDLCLTLFKELYRFGRDKGIPIGCNVESVSIRKAEIEASTAMVNEVDEIFRRNA